MDLIKFVVDVTGLTILSLGLMDLTNKFFFGRYDFQPVEARFESDKERDRRLKEEKEEKELRDRRLEAVERDRWLETGG